MYWECGDCVRVFFVWVRACCDVRKLYITELRFSVALYYVFSLYRSNE